MHLLASILILLTESWKEVIEYLIKISELRFNLLIRIKYAKVYFIHVWSIISKNFVN